MTEQDPDIVDAPIHTEIDDDPTGMRALLRGLPDPGPMPADLVARIQASLAAEVRERDTAPPVSLDAHRARRTRRSRQLLPWAAAAGILAVAGGGVLMSTGGGSVLESALTGPKTAQAVAGRSAAALSGGGAADAPASSVGPATTVVVMTNRAWTDTDLPGAATSASASAPLRDLAAESPEIGPIGTPLGARDCAKALGIADDSAVVVDLGTYAGSPAALVVATTPRGERTAYVVSRQCRLGAPEVRSGPHAV